MQRIGKIELLGSALYVPPRNALQISASVKGERITCYVTIETLERCFSLSSLTEAHMVECYRQNHKAIEAGLQEKYSRDEYETAAVLVLHPQDVSIEAS